MTTIRIGSSFFICLLLALTPTQLAARVNGAHWYTTSHYHPPQIAIGWFNNGHWMTSAGYFENPDPTSFRQIASGGTTLAAPDSFGDNMFDMVLMDEHMNMLAHRTTADLASLQHSWTLDKVAAGTNGYQFQWQFFRLATDDGYSEELLSPMTIPMTLMALTPDTTPGSTLHDAVFRGTIPTGTMRWTSVDPIYGSTPYLVFNDAPVEFEVFLQFAVPEPTFGWVLIVGVTGYACYRRTLRTRRI
jgi:hypothetical protein